MRKFILSAIAIGMLLNTCSGAWATHVVKIVVNAMSDASGSSNTTYAVKSDGTVWSWGMNVWGQLGDGSNVYAVTYSSTPVQVKGLTSVIDLKAGGGTAYALKSDGTVWSWGGNVWGQLGDRSNVYAVTYSSTPVQVFGMADTDAPTGSLLINAGAAYTASTAVTLAISAVDNGGDGTGGLSQMMISNSSTFSGGAWESYATSKSWTLTSTQGTKTVYAKFKDVAGNISSVVNAKIVLDTSAPAIISSSVVPKMAAAGDTLTVTVGSTDTSGVASVTADGTALSPAGGDLWQGSIAASSTLGTHPVTVAASDTLGHTANNTSGSYLTTTVVGMAGKGASDQIMDAATSQKLFMVWGKVENAGSDTFDIDNGSGDVIRVTATGYRNALGIKDGDYVSARGILDVSTMPRSLASGTQYVQKRN